MKQMPLLLLLATAACNDSIPGLCKSASDCPSPTTCNQGLCAFDFDAGTSDGGNDAAGADSGKPPFVDDGGGSLDGAALDASTGIGDGGAPFAGDGGSRDAESKDAESGDASSGGDAGSACSQAVVDQRLGPCSSPPITQCAPAYLLSNGQSAAQVFSPELSGRLVSVRLRISNPTQYVVRVSLLSAEDALPLSDPNFDLAAHAIATSDLPMSVMMAWQTVTLASQPWVVAGKFYIILVQLIGAPDETNIALWDEYNDWQGAQVDSYPRGRAYSCGRGCASWNLEPTYRDYAFETYVASCP